MKKEENVIHATAWYYKVHVSKDSPNNPKMGDFKHLPDNEYSRGCYLPGSYTTLDEAKKALAYYGVGHIEKYRHATIDRGYKLGRSEIRETKTINTL